MKISVLIASRDRPEMLVRCLRHVVAQDHPEREILVLDDGSETVDLGDVVRRAFPGEAIRCLRSDRPLGVAASRNLLMSAATGEVFCVIDDDAYFASPGVLARLAACFAAEPGAGIVAFRIVNREASGRRMLLPFSRFWKWRRPGLTRAQRRVSYFVGTAHAIRRVVIEQCGGYDEQFYFGEEELDLAYRALEAGFTCEYAPELCVHHTPQPSVLAGRERQEISCHVRNRIGLAYRYLPFVHVPIYLLVWFGALGWRALRQGHPGALLEGGQAALRALPTLERRVLSKPVRRYLRQHYGRLWY